MSASWQERLWSKATRSEDGCWIWQGAKNWGGYGIFTVSPGIFGASLTVRAHRAALVAVGRELPEGLEVDHLCNVRACINPDHLEAVTNAENNRRRAERRTHCDLGHEYTDENTRRRSAGERQCLICKRAYERDYYRARKAAVASP